MGKTVLIVDDSKTVRVRVGGTLRQAGYDVIEAVDGVEALENLDRGSIDMVICDVNMPRMSGMEVLQALQQRKDLTPVVMLTTEGEGEMVSQARAAGAKGWIIKPFKPEALVATVKKLTGS